MVDNTQQQIDPCLSDDDILGDNQASQSIQEDPITSQILSEQNKAIINRNYWTTALQLRAKRSLHKKSDALKEEIEVLQHQRDLKVSQIQETNQKIQEQDRMDAKVIEQLQSQIQKLQEENKSLESRPSKNGKYVTSFSAQSIESYESQKEAIEKKFDEDIEKTKKQIEEAKIKKEAVEKEFAEVLE